MNKLFLIAKHDWSETVRKPYFWISIFLLPVIGLIIGLISYFSNASLNKPTDLGQINSTLVVDEGNYFTTDILPENYQKIANLNEGLDQLKSKKIDLLIYYPKDLIENKTIQIFTLNPSKTNFKDVALMLINKSIATEINDPIKRQLYEAPLNVENKSLDNSDESEAKTKATILSIINLFLYFWLITSSLGSILACATEEKENKLIEIMLIAVKPKVFLGGKLLGQIMILLTQLGTIILVAYLLINIFKPQLPSDLNILASYINISTVVRMIFYLFCGFLILANLIIGIGIAMPTVKESQRFMSFFIILTILPIYFFGNIIAEPAGTLSLITSYFPFTSAMILQYRNFVGVLSWPEGILSTMILLGYVIVSFLIAVKLFKLGSLEYGKKISFQSLLNNKNLN